MVEQLRTGRPSGHAFAQHGGPVAAPSFPEDGAPAGLSGSARHRSVARSSRTGTRTAVAAALFSLPTGGLAAAVLSPQLPGAEDTGSLQANLAANSSPMDAPSVDSPTAAMSLTPHATTAQDTLNAVAAGVPQGPAAGPATGQQIVELQKVAPAEKVVEDDSLPEGTRTVVDPGADGAQSSIWRVNYAGGKEVSREQIGSGATTPAKPRVVKVGAKKKAAESAGSEAKPEVAAAGGAVWDKLAKCEAGGDWSTNSGNGYYGGLQFDKQTWSAYDGTQFAPTPDQASREEQITVANKIKDERGGYSAWPSCSSKLGLS